MKTCNLITSKTIALLILVLIISSAKLFAGNYVWTGATDSSWSVSTNWTPTGTPGVTDTVTITAGTRNCVLVSNVTIKEFNITDDTLNLNTYTLTITDNATNLDGLITNGTFKIAGSGEVVFWGGVVSSTVEISANSILFSGATFNGNVYAVKKSSTTSTGDGGCTFSAPVTLIDSGSGYWTFGNSNADFYLDSVKVVETSSGIIFIAHNSEGNSFSKNVTFTSTSTGRIYCDYYGSSTFHDSVLVNSTNTGAIYFGYGGGLTYLDTSVISIGSLGLSSTSTLHLQGIHQEDASKTVTLLATGNSIIIFESDNVFEGRVIVVAPRFSLAGSTFNNVTLLTKTGASPTTSSGGCYFADSTFIVHSTPTLGIMITGVDNADVFAGPTSIVNVGGLFAIINAQFLNNTSIYNFTKDAILMGAPINGTFLAGFSGATYFADTLSLFSDSASFSFGEQDGYAIFDSTAYLLIDSGYTSNLLLSNFYYLTLNDLNIPFENNPGGIHFDLTVSAGKVNCVAQKVEIENSLFVQDFYLKRVQGGDDTCRGGNVFYGPVTIIDSNSTGGTSLIMATENPDDYNGDVTFQNFGDGYLFPCYSQNSTFAGDIKFGGTYRVDLGVDGGKVIIDGDGDQKLKNLDGVSHSFSKLEMNKESGNFILFDQLTVSDSLIFNKGFIVSDSLHPVKLNFGFVEGASDSSHVIGVMKKLGFDEFAFPLGDGVYFHPINVSAPSTMCTFTAAYVSANHNLGLNCDSTIENPSLCEYWTLYCDTNNSNVTIGLGWNENSCNVYGMDSMRVAVWNENDSIWEDKGNGGTTGGLSFGSVISDSSISSFGVITIADLFCTSLFSNAHSTDVTCPGKHNGKLISIPKGATPPYNYTWYPEITGNSVVEELPSGEYYLDVSDSRGCTITDTIIINSPDSINLEIITTNSDCHDSTGTAKIITSGGDSSLYYYFWTNGISKTDSANFLSSGIYKVTVTDALGCSVDTLVTISDSDGPEVDIDTIVNVLCNGDNTGSISLTESSELHITWPCTVVNQNRLTGGNYPLIISDTNGCKTGYVLEIAEPAPLNVSVFTTQSVCGDSTGSATAFATGGTGELFFQWSSGSDSNLAFNLPSGFDTVFVTDENGCTSQAIVLITDSNSFDISISKTDVLCFGDSSGTASVSLVGGTSPFTFTWSHELADTAIQLNLYAGRYAVLVEDSNECLSVDSVSILQPDPLSISAFIESPTGDTLTDGVIRTQVSGGTLPYSYSWTPGSETTPFISGLGSGTYQVTVTDNNGCIRAYDPIIINPSYCVGGTGCNSHSDLLCAYNTCLTCPPIPSICNNCNLTYDIVSDFGADFTGSSSSECAFEFASYFINEVYNQFPGPNGISSLTINFPAGDYIVGRQDDFGTFDNNCWFKKGHHIFYLGVRNVPAPNNTKVFIHDLNLVGTVDGDGNPTTFIKFEDCLKYGAFNPANGNRYLHAPYPCPNVNVPCNYVAYPGDLFVLMNGRDILISGLDLNGNAENMDFGGDYQALQPLAHDGIVIYDTYNVSLQDVFSHDFARDGLMVPQMLFNHWTDCQNHLLNLSMNHCKFNSNHRTGFAWCGGTLVNAVDCEFNYNGQGSFRMAMSVGLDLEWEFRVDGNCTTCYDANQVIYPCNYQQNVSNGHFTNCLFNFNYAGGAFCDRPSYSSLTKFQGDYFFEDCTFIGSETGSAIRPSGRNFNFNCCYMYGLCDYAYDGTAKTPQAANNYNTKFSNCSFNEEWTDPSDGVTVKAIVTRPLDYSYGQSNPTAACSTVTSQIWDRPVMINFAAEPGFGGNPRYKGCGRVKFNNCLFNTNYHLKWGAFNGTYSTDLLLPYFNNQQFSNCVFTNLGQESRPCNFGGCGPQNRSLGYFSHFTFTGINNFNYPSTAKDWNGGSNLNCYFIGFDNNPVLWMDWPQYTMNGQDCCQSIICGATQNFNLPVTIYPTSFTTDCAPKYVSPDPGYHWKFDAQICDFPYYWEVPQYCLGRESNGDCMGYVSNACFTYCPECTQRNQTSFTIDKTKILVSPVPAQDYLHLKNLSQQDIIIVRNIVGMEIERIETTNSEVDINLQRYAPGIYYIYVKGKDSAKFIKL